ncbi:MAG TPA: hypothetical protein VGM14_03725 [Streptosporangiaceae bacterium]|jgi:hypothetical protein
MSERDARYVGNEASAYPSSTGEFRAAPDASASTAEFKRFAAGQANGASPATDAGSWPEQPWDASSPGGGGSSGGSSRMKAIVAGVVVLVIVVIALILFA